MSNKEKYRRFCRSKKDMPLFLTYEWMEAMSAGGEWDVAVSESGGETVGVLPYFIRKKMGLKILGHPPLTPYLGPWLAFPEGQKYAKRLSFEKQCLEDLIEQLPPFADFNMKFHPLFKNEMPFRWKGFNQTSCYTYIIENLEDTDELFGDFRGNIRRQIKKAEKLVKVIETEDINLVFQLKEMAYTEKEAELPYDFEDIAHADKLCRQKGCRKIWFAVDENDDSHSVLYLVWDQNSSYYLIGSRNPRHQNSGAMSLLMWEAIKFSRKVTKSFNFEGSMIEPIERYFRAFGGRQTPYHNVYKTNSKLLNIKRNLT